jgi:hypothetical protein
VTEEIDLVDQVTRIWKTKRKGNKNSRYPSYVKLIQFSKNPNKLTADEGQFDEITGPTEDDAAAPIDPLSFLEHTKENDTLSSQCHLTVEVKIANHPQGKWSVPII